MKYAVPEINGRAFWACACALTFASPLAAQDLSGRVKQTYRCVSAGADSMVAAFGGPQYTGIYGNTRLMWSKRWGEWAAVAHYKLSLETGESAAITRAMSGAMPALPPSTYFDLSRTISDSDDLIATHSIDRLSLSYSAPSFVVRVGRQALTWGSGMAFRPMDLVAPFSPATMDTEFKPGADMIYMQWLMNDGSDLELIAVPRREVAGGPATMEASTFGMRYQTSVGDLGVNVIAARDHGDWTAGLGLSGSLGGAAWNAEIVPTQLADGSVRTSGMVNISTAIGVFGKTAMVFGEYFHNGFGESGNAISLATLSPELVERMSRGQVFNVGQDYLSLGLSMELTPLVSIGGGGIINLADQSYVGSAQLNWSIGDNSNLMIGAQIPGGARGTEFGGLSLGGGGAPYLGPEPSAFVQYRQYF